MYKVDINPITGKVMSYTKVRSNIPIYDDDMLVDDNEISSICVGSTMPGYETPDFSEDYENAIRLLDEVRKKISSENDMDYFIKLVVDEGKDVAEARDSIKQRRAQIEDLDNKIRSKYQEYEDAIRKFWMSKDADADSDYPYYSAAILLIKDENRYLREWLDWHLGLGFDHVFIYDNGMQEHVSEIVSEYPEDKQAKITVIDWGGHHKHIQQDAYNHFLEHHKAAVRWGLFIDSDEFLRFTDGTTDVNEFLKRYEDYTEIWGYELEYDANGNEMYEDKPVRERFTRRTDVREGFYWKNFIQVNRISSFLMHYAQYNEQKHYLYKDEECNKNLFVIDHYYTKSWEEWKVKIKERGGADPKYHKSLQEFFVYNPDMDHLNNGDTAYQAYE